MKIVFIVYHDILDDRISNMFDELKIDFFTEWENVKGKGHSSDAHLGSRTFPGYNSVRMIAFQQEKVLDDLTEKLSKLNDEIIRTDDKIRLFQIPLERII